jgi:hypothetical protein
MNTPRPVSTLAQAVRWMTESTDTEWTGDSLLDFIFKKMSAQPTTSPTKQKKGIGLSALTPYFLYVSLPPTAGTVSCYRDEKSKLKTFREEPGKTSLLPLKNRKYVLALLQDGAIELPYPLISGYWEGAEGFWIDTDKAPVITSESLRIYAYNLVFLAYIFCGQPGMKAEAFELLGKLGIKGAKRNAPPPEKRLSNKGSVPISSLVETKAKAPDDWNFWRHMLQVGAWQACALSVNIDPDSMEPDMSGGNGPHFGEESFPNNTIKVEYEKRLRLLKGYLSDSSFFSPSTQHMGNPNLRGVKLAEFATWALSFGWKLPPELKSMASQKGPQVTQEGLASHEGEVSVDGKLTPQAAPESPTVLVRQRKNLSDEDDLETIPGRIPRTGNGKLAVKAAWYWKCKTGKRATVREVLALLIEWAKSGKEPELRVNQKNILAVDWVTTIGKPKPYHYTALEKTLGKWNKSIKSVETK